MSSLEISHIDLEQGNVSDVSVCFSDFDEGSCYSRFYSTVGGDSYGGASDSKRVSSVSDCSVVEKVERNCRICHLGLESNSYESGIPIELGCSCKNDLAAAHKHCAETWFKMRGNKTCEICQSIALNVVGLNEFESTGQANEIDGSSTTATISGPATPYTDTRSFCHGHHILNFLLACMVFAFVISLFHFNMPSY